MTDKTFIATLVGLALEEVYKLVDSKNLRVMRLDGDDKMGTCDFREERINLSVKDGVVDEAWSG